MELFETLGWVLLILLGLYFTFLGLTRHRGLFFAVVGGLAVLGIAFKVNESDPAAAESFLVVVVVVMVIAGIIHAVIKQKRDG